MKKTYQILVLLLIGFPMISHSQKLMLKPEEIQPMTGSHKGDSIYMTFTQEFKDSIKQEAKTAFYKDRHNLAVFGFNFKPLYDSLNKKAGEGHWHAVSLRTYLELAKYNLKASLIAMAQMDHRQFDGIFGSHKNQVDTTGITYLDQAEKEQAFKHPQSIAAKQILVYNLLDEVDGLRLQYITDYFSSLDYPVLVKQLELQGLPMGVSYDVRKDHLRCGGYSPIASRKGVSEKDRPAYNEALAFTAQGYLTSAAHSYLQLK